MCGSHAKEITRYRHLSRRRRGCVPEPVRARGTDGSGQGSARGARRGASGRVEYLVARRATPHRRRGSSRGPVGESCGSRPSLFFAGKTPARRGRDRRRSHRAARCGHAHVRRHPLPSRSHLPEDDLGGEEGEEGRRRRRRLRQLAQSTDATRGSGFRELPRRSTGGLPHRRVQPTRDGRRPGHPAKTRRVRGVRVPPAQRARVGRGHGVDGRIRRRG